MSTSVVPWLPQLEKNWQYLCIIYSPAEAPLIAQPAGCFSHAAVAAAAVLCTKLAHCGRILTCKTDSRRVLAQVLVQPVFARARAAGVPV